MDEKESDEDRALRLVLAYKLIFKSGWPLRIHVWAWHTMPKELNKNYTGNEVIDFYKKKINKIKYFELLEKFNLGKTSYERSL